VTAARSGRSPAGRSKAPNRKLLYVLGVVIVLALALKVVPGLLGGGGHAARVQPRIAFHLATPGVGKASPGSNAPIGRPARDPFATPPGANAGR
jgi:hypothetical protein